MEVDGERERDVVGVGIAGRGSLEARGGGERGGGEDDVGETRKVDYYEILGVPFDSSEQRIEARTSRRR